MACLTTNPFTMHGCTDANIYYAGATTVDFQLECQNNSVGASFSYTAKLQYYHPALRLWLDKDSKSGVFANKTKVFSYSLANKPAGQYRIFVNFDASPIIKPFSAQTSTFTVYR